jgi:hypothetical protein
MASRRWIPILVSLAATAVLSTCSGDRIVDHAKLEREVTDQSSSQKFPLSAVACPEGRPLVTGDTFTCSATLAGGEPVTVEATQTDGDGTITWRRVEAAVTGEEFAGLEDDLIDVEYGVTITLTCPSVIVVNDGDSFTCTGIDERGHTRDVVFTAVHARNGEFTHVVDGLPPPTTTTTTIAG